MAETASNMLPLRTKAPYFSLQDTISNQVLSLDELHSKIATVIMFLSNHCPYVKHIQQKLVQVANSYQAKGVQFVAIGSNDVDQYPEDGPEKMKIEAQMFDYPFPYLYDPTQEVAKSYQAACTPDFYIFDSTLSCVYRGCFDESTPGNPYPVTGSHLSNALDSLLAGKAVDSHQRPSLGCNIKWK